MKKNFGMAKNFGASEKIYFEIFKINDFGMGFKASDVFAALLLPVKWTFIMPIMSLHASFFFSMKKHLKKICFVVGP